MSLRRLRRAGLAFVYTSLFAVLSSASARAQSAAELISEDDMVDYLTKTLVVYATHQGDAWICGANPEVQQCTETLQAFDERHFPEVTNPVTVDTVRNGAYGKGSKKTNLATTCRLRLSGSLETFRAWGDVLKGADSTWDSGIANVRSRVNAGGCSTDEIAYFDKITATALERAENIVPKVKSQAADRSEALAQCKASAAYKRFDDAASIPNLKANLSTQESYLEEYQRTQPTTVQDANKLRNSVAKENGLIATLKQALNQKSNEYQGLGGNVNDVVHMSKDASSNPCATLGDDWQHNFQ